MKKWIILLLMAGMVLSHGCYTQVKFSAVMRENESGQGEEEEYPEPEVVIDPIPVIVIPTPVMIPTLIEQHPVEAPQKSQKQRHFSPRSVGGESGEVKPETQRPFPRRGDHTSSDAVAPSDPPVENRSSRADQPDWNDRLHHLLTETSIMRPVIETSTTPVRSASIMATVRRTVHKMMQEDRSFYYKPDPYTEHANHPISGSTAEATNDNNISAVATESSSTDSQPSGGYSSGLLHQESSAAVVSHPERSESSNPEYQGRRR